EDALDRLVDEHGGVVHYAVIDPLRKVLLEFFHLGPDVLCRLDRVRAGELEDGEGDGRVAVKVAVDVVILSAQLHALLVGPVVGNHVAEVGGGPVGIGLDDDGAKLVFALEPAESVKGELEVLPRGGWWLAEPAGGYLDVLLADAADHVTGGHAPRRQLLRIE